MHFSPAALLALLPCAVADFLIITDYPAALATMNAAQVRRVVSSRSSITINMQAS
jgi:hypothetical protein